MGGRRRREWGVWFVCLVVLAGAASGNVVLIGRNVSLSFEDMEANFAPAIKSSGECGALYIAQPLDACSPVMNKDINGSSSPFALIIRGRCTFDDKVRNAQNGGFNAAIIYDNEDDSALVAMSGSPGGVKIHAVFISKTSGETLKKYAGHPGAELWILPTFENSAWSIMAISFISLLAMSAVLAACFFVRGQSIRRERPRATPVREFRGMSSRLVKAMPSLIFTSVLEDNCTSMTCAICLEDYNVGDKLRILPCRHKFHAFCVDSWLTSWRTFCPVCKRDARTSSDKPTASESTPLLLAGPVSPASSTGLSMHHSSPAIQIVQSPSCSPLTSRNHSLSNTPHMLTQLRSYSNSPDMSMGRNSLVPRNTSSQISHASYLMPAHSQGLLSPSPSSRFSSLHIHNSCYGSPGFLVGSSSRQSFLHNSESATSLSAFSSAQSLPEC